MNLANVIEKYTAELADTDAQRANLLDLLNDQKIDYSPAGPNGVGILNQEAFAADPIVREMQEEYDILTTQGATLARVLADLKQLR